MVVILAKKFDMFLSLLAGLVDQLAALAGALVELLVLILNLGVETLEHGQNRALESLGRLGVGVGDGLTGVSTPLLAKTSSSRHAYLSVGSDVLKHARDTS